MGIKLGVYLKRTSQKLEDWLDANKINAPAELLPRCAYIGLSIDQTDIANVNDVFKKREKMKQEKAAAELQASVKNVVEVSDVVEASDVVEEVQQQPAVEDKPKKKKSQKIVEA
jgi:hypothetical protein